MHRCRSNGGPEHRLALLSSSWCVPSAAAAAAFLESVLPPLGVELTPGMRRVPQRSTPRPLAGGRCSLATAAAPWRLPLDAAEGDAAGPISKALALALHGRYVDLANQLDNSARGMNWPEELDAGAKDFCA